MINNDTASAATNRMLIIILIIFSSIIKIIDGSPLSSSIPAISLKSTLIFSCPNSIGFASPFISVISDISLTIDSYNP